MTQEQKEKLINGIINKAGTIYFMIPESEGVSASVMEMFQHAAVLKEEGYNVVGVVSDNYEVPYWVDEELQTFEIKKHKDMGSISTSPIDMFIVPEVETPIMNQLYESKIPSIKVALLQSFDLMLKSLTHGGNWMNLFGINNVITTSEKIKGEFEYFFGSRYDTKVAKPTIPDYFFGERDETQLPIISVIGRNPDEIQNIMKLFVQKYPTFGANMSFDPMVTETNPPQQLSRKEFAQRLKKNFISLWIDRKSTFGTFPLECMAAGSIPISLIPDLKPEYITTKDEDGNIRFKEDGVGFWSDDIYALIDGIYSHITAFTDDKISDDLYDKMSQTASEYKLENTRQSILDSYSHFFNKQKQIIENINVEANA